MANFDIVAHTRDIRQTVAANVLQIGLVDFLGGLVEEDLFCFGILDIHVKIRHVEVTPLEYFRRWDVTSDPAEAPIELGRQFLVDVAVTHIFLTQALSDKF